jgi:fatty acid-binding protein DegV
MEKVMNHIKRLCAERPIWNYVVLHAANEEAAVWYTEKMQALTGLAPASVVNISPAIGVHAGIGAAAVSFMYD